jgi:hypothetical protein
MRIWADGEESTGWSERSGRTFEIAVFLADSWECVAQNDGTAFPGRELGDVYHLYFKIRETL